MDVRMVSAYREWRVTKTGPIHAYTKDQYGGDGNSGPACGIGPSKRLTEALRPDSKDPIHCADCVRALHETGEVYVSRKKAAV